MVGAEAMTKAEGDAGAGAAPDGGRFPVARFAARLAIVTVEITLVILLGAGGFKFFYQGF